MYTKKTQASVDKFTEQGDGFLRLKEFNYALLAFNEAITAEKKNQNKNMRSKRLKIMYAKRSLVFFKLAQYKNSLEDAQCAINLQLKEHEQELENVFLEVKNIVKVVIDISMKTDREVRSQLIRRA